MHRYTQADSFALVLQVPPSLLQAPLVLLQLLLPGVQAHHRPLQHVRLAVEISLLLHKKL